MLQWTITFLVLALIAGLLGFTAGVGAAAALVAKALFYIFLALVVISALSRVLTDKTH
ncbi:DUF1328 domain-containing protein [Luteolibacter pohnpeiensis]|uniref:DUF1328 domain-containing protein n=2 Tax=Luteolibacter pohnpeiensis TaxID=454153 RepID=A0A934S5B9_9BACT|nr:DUF1328 domain-containing protein [Luteolibacter pohnpeiensis]